MDRKPPSLWRNWWKFHRFSEVISCFSPANLWFSLDSKSMLQAFTVDQSTNAFRGSRCSCQGRNIKKTPSRSVTKAAKTAGSDVLYLPRALRDPSLLGMEEASPCRCHAPGAAKGQERWVDGEFPRQNPPDPSRKGLAISFLRGYMNPHWIKDVKCPDEGLDADVLLGKGFFWKCETWT